MEQLHVIVGAGARVLLLLHGDARDGGGGQVVVNQAEAQQLVGEAGTSNGRSEDGCENGRPEARGLYFVKKFNNLPEFDCCFGCRI